MKLTTLKLKAICDVIADGEATLAPIVIYKLAATLAGLGEERPAPGEIRACLTFMYGEKAKTKLPTRQQSLSERNAEICARYAAGEKAEAICLDYGLTRSRIVQIVTRSGVVQFESR